jgi:antitoxin (DNA-binding transcriptional repressor) of toxin-antitoxin stability system
MAKHEIHVSERDAATEFASLLEKVRSDAEIVIENGANVIAVLHPAATKSRPIAECIALLPENSNATIDPDFEKDVEAAVDSHREPLEPPAWD